MSGEDRTGEGELDAELDARFARAPREAEPGRDLWPGIERALDATGAGRGGVAERVGDRARRVPVPLQIAAALALFASGVLVGQRGSGDRVPTEAVREAPVVRPADALAAAAEVQRTGSAYVSALSRLDGTAGALEREQAVDAALSTLQGAAWEIVRLRPDDPQAGRILYTVSEARTDGEPTVRF